jgi:hypothetical protein
MSTSPLPSATSSEPAPDVFEQLLQCSGLLTAKELARIVNLSPKTLYSYAERDLIPHFRIETNVRFRGRDVADWLRQRRLYGNNHFLPQPDGMFRSRVERAANRIAQACEGKRVLDLPSTLESDRARRRESAMQGIAALRRENCRENRFRSNQLDPCSSCIPGSKQNSTPKTTDDP